MTELEQKLTARLEEWESFRQGREDYLGRLKQRQRESNKWARDAYTRAMVDVEKLLSTMPSKEIS